MKEADLQRRITDMATRFNWAWWHVPAPMRWTAKGWVPAREAAGLPDLVLMHDDPPRLIFAEVKGSGGKVAEKQIDFLRRAKIIADVSFDPSQPLGNWPSGCTIGVYLVTPATEDTFEQVLRSKVMA